jgi:hypothetical protein
MTKYYQTIEEASLSAKNLNINSILEYKLRYKEDRMLPKNPSYLYKNRWNDFGGWKLFINCVKSNKNKCYKNIQEASFAAINLGITSEYDYLIKHKQDPRLYIRPDALYWQNGAFNWDVFLGIPLTFTFNDFIEIIISLNITSISEYKSFAHIKNGIPKFPEEKYSCVWKLIGGWDGVFEMSKKTYKTFKEASIAALYLKIYTKEDYLKNCHIDKKLPSEPHLYYSDWEDKGGWLSFFNKNILIYNKIEDASVASINLGINSSISYSKNRFKDPRLPANPEHFYPDWKLFKKWSGFLKIELKIQKSYARRISDKTNIKKDKKYYTKLNDAHKAIKKLNIKSFKEYRKLYKNDKMLPSNLPQYYLNEWFEFGGWDSVFNY